MSQTYRQRLDALILEGLEAFDSLDRSGPARGVPPRRRKRPVREDKVKDPFLSLDLKAPPIPLSPDSYRAEVNALAWTMRNVEAYRCPVQSTWDMHLNEHEWLTSIDGARAVCALSPNAARFEDYGLLDGRIDWQVIATYAFAEDVLERLEHHHPESQLLEFRQTERLAQELADQYQAHGGRF